MQSNTVMVTVSALQMNAAQLTDFMEFDVVYSRSFIPHANVNANVNDACTYDACTMSKIVHIPQ